jgi:hypothetical protein
MSVRLTEDRPNGPFDKRSPVVGRRHYGKCQPV